MAAAALITTAAHKPRRQPEHQPRKAEDVLVEPHHDAPQPPAAGDAQQRARHQHQRHQGQIVTPHLRVRVTQRLQRRDLSALEGHQAGQHDVDQEGGHAQEDDRHHAGQRPQLAQLAGQDSIRRLMLAAHGADAAVRGQQPIEGRQRLRRGGTRLQPHADVVERPLQLERGGDDRSVHPEHRVALGIVRQGAWPDGVNELRRLRGPDDANAPLGAVDDDRQPVAVRQVVRPGERRQHDRLVVVSRRRHAAALQEDGVGRRVALRRQRDDLPVSGPIQVVQRKGHVLDDAGLHQRDPGQPFDARGQRLGRALDAREHVGEARAVVVGVARVLERSERPAQRDEAGDATREHQRDGRDLPFEGARLPEQLAIEGRDQGHRAALTTGRHWPARGGRRTARTGCGRRPA
ncbi:MAG TPA: hypothetical protein VHM31_25655 [Polyangia bacterium]|nr:hypothetical protein [Polyangia bacterium]